MTKKQFSTIKIGYSRGVYGCTGEYFTTIVVNSKGLSSFRFYGLYGSEERIARALKDKGYEEVYTQSLYGQVTRNDIPKKAVMPENTALDYIAAIFKN